MNLKTKIVPLLFLILGICSILAQNVVEFEAKLIYSTQIYFDFGKTELRVTDLSTLDYIDSLLQENPYRSIRISAHTDAIGKKEANKKLSFNRASTVIEFLKTKGIDQQRLHYEYFGEALPQADNASDQGRQQNRRAQIDVLEEIPKQTLVKLSGQVKDSMGNGLLAKVLLRAKNFEDSLITQVDGKYSFELPDSMIVLLDIYAEAYFFDSKILRVTDKMMPIKTVLKKAECGAVFPLRKMYFYGNRSTLLPKSKPELKRLLYFMSLNQNLKLEIGGHINRPFTKASQLSYFDRQLSVNRAKMVYDFLVSNGIYENRLHYKGYGNKFMIYPKATKEAQMKMNRRVELKVLCETKEKALKKHSE